MNLRELFYNTVYRIFDNRLTFESLYSEILPDLEDSDKRRLINLVNQFFRNYNFLEKVLVDRIEKKIDNQSLKMSILLLCAGIEFFWMNSSTDYSVVNDYVEIAKTRLGLGRSKYVNAILRKMTKLEISEDDKNSKQALYLSHPQWVTDKLIDTYGKPVTEDIYRFNQSIPKVYIRANRIMNSAEELLKILEREGLQTELTDGFPDFLKVMKGNPVASSSFKEGRFYIQDPSHSIPVLLLDPKKNEKVLDLCCAPGGKSTYIQELTDNRSKLYLNDISKKKRVIIKENFKRLGHVYEKLTFQEAEKFQDFQEFDKILIDAPCTGSGNFRRHPESRWNKDEEMLADLTKLQLEILKKASIYPKKGGCIVYSTCSIFKEENMDIINAFLEFDDDYKIETSKTEFLETFRNDDGSYLVNPGIHRHEGAFAVCLRRVQ